MIFVRILRCVVITTAFLPTTSLPAQPESAIVYTNKVDGHVNRFVIGPKESTSGARYILKPGMPVQFDRLIFIRDVEFPDGRANSPQIVRGWMYKGMDKSENTWRIIFGKEQNTIPDTYPIYYSFKQDGGFERWLVAGDSRRSNARFDDEIHAILWANQVDVDRLGLTPFDTRRQSPLAVSLAWNSIRPELNRKLAQSGSSVGNEIVKRPDGKVQVDLDASGPDRDKLFQSLNFSHDLDIKVDWRQLTRSQIVTTLSQKFFTDGKVDYAKVAENIQSLVRNDSPELSQLGLRTTSRFLANQCIVSSTPWREIGCDERYCQFWKVRFGFAKVMKEGTESFELSLLYDVGECRTEEKDRGESFIIHKYQSLDGAEFASLSTSLSREGQQQVTETLDVTLPLSMPDGYSLYNPMDSFNLKDVFDRTFRIYVSRMQKK